MSDGSSLRRQLARRVRIRARNVAPGAYRVRVAAIGAHGARWNGTTTPLRWHDAGCAVARDGVVEIAPTEMDANSVWLFDVHRRARCPIGASR